MSTKLWGGRFTQPTDKFVEEFTASIDFDQRLYRYDIQALKPMLRCSAAKGSSAQMRPLKLSQG